MSEAEVGLTPQPPRNEKELTKSIQELAKKPHGVPDEYVMVPHEVPLTYHKSPWFSVPFELGNQELGGVGEAPQALDAEVVGVFSVLGLPEPQSIAVLPSAVPVAHALHA